MVGGTFVAWYRYIYSSQQWLFYSYLKNTLLAKYQSRKIHFSVNHLYFLFNTRIRNVGWLFTVNVVRRWGKGPLLSEVAQSSGGLLWPASVRLSESVSIRVGCRGASPPPPPPPWSILYDVNYARHRSTEGGNNINCIYYIIELSTGRLKRAVQSVL